jgi:glycosyltransferase involved in cell wall biosynthesis
MSPAPRASRASPLRVLMTADTVGGVWTYVLELARALASHGVVVELATMGREPSAAQRAEAAAVPGLALHASAWRLEWMDEPWDDVARAGEWLLGLERALAPDVVHLNGYAHGALPWRAPALVVAHSDVCSWWRAVHGEEAPAAWDHYRAAVRAGLHAAALVVAPTRAVLDGMAPLYGAPARSRVVPNGRDAGAFAPAAKEPIVLTVGRLWDEAKNVAAVARAAERLPWPVYVAGDAAPPAHTGGGWDPGASERVRFLGALAPAVVACWLRRASVYALPARYEPFGLSALEAALAGCALVVGDLPSQREVWGDAADYVDPRDDDALARAIGALVDDAPRRQARADAARERALAYTPARMAAGYLAAYADAATPTRREELQPCAS